MTTHGCGCSMPAAALQLLDHGHAAGKCPHELSEPKNMLCRPCAKGWHETVPCDRYRAEPVKHLLKTCAWCGFDSAAHPLPPELGGRA